MESEKPKKTGETRAKPTEDALYQLLDGVRKVAKIADSIEPESRDEKKARLAEQNAARQAAWRERQKAINADLLATEQAKTAELEAKLATLPKPAPETAAAVMTAGANFTAASQLQPDQAALQAAETARKQAEQAMAAAKLTASRWRAAAGVGAVLLVLLTIALAMV